VIASNTTSIPEVAGEAAYYIDPLDTADIAAKMLDIASDSRLRSEIVQKGWQRVQEFGWENSAKKHLEIFSKII